jgi:hypothetical protein
MPSPNARSWMMKAAVLHALGEAPRYEDFAEPTPNNDEAIVSVRAASLEDGFARQAGDGGYEVVLDYFGAARPRRWLPPSRATT